MKIVIAFDSFKGSLSSLEAGHAAAKGIRRFNSQIETKVILMADGGEGTVSALVEGLNGKIETVTVTGPLTERISAQYGIIFGDTAVIEMSSAAGLVLVPEEKRNPLNTTTFGLGEMILDAIDKGVRNFLIGIGGSATNDGGTGMLKALGFKILDEEGKQIKNGAAGLKDIHSIFADDVRQELKECTFSVACDVDNPLCGEAGCSKVFGPQKGATPEMVELMDSWLRAYADKAKEAFPDANPDFPGSGAAGGLGFAFRTFLGAKLENGAELVANATKMSEHVKDADLVITGEGMIDGQTSRGKAPIGVAKIAKKYNVPVVVLAGAIGKDAGKCNNNGIDAFFSIVPGACSLDEAMNRDNAIRNIENTAEQVVRLYSLK